MEIFNIGIPEFLFILVIMLILLGPEGMASSARTFGKTIRRVIHSPLWGEFMRAQQEIQELPTRLVREAGIEDFNREIADLNDKVRESIPSETYSIRPMDSKAALEADPSLQAELDQAAKTEPAGADPDEEKPNDA